MIPIITSVQLGKLKMSHSDLKELIDNLLVNVKTRLDHIEKNKTITAACLLDPRVKDTCFSDSVNRTMAVNNLNRELENIHYKNNNLSSSLIFLNKNYKKLQ